MEIKNLYEQIPQQLQNEQFIELLNDGQVLIERIVSQGHQSQWFDQEKSEWVVVLEGEAIISFREQPDRYLKKGDYLFIPAHQQHRVKWTSESENTIWLAIHF